MQFPGISGPKKVRSDAFAISMTPKQPNCWFCIIHLSLSHYLSLSFSSSLCFSPFLTLCSLLSTSLSLLLPFFLHLSLPLFLTLSLYYLLPLALTPSFKIVLSFPLFAFTTPLPNKTYSASPKAFDRFTNHCYKGLAAQHRGSILASHPAAPGLNPGTAEIFSLYC